MSPDAIHRLVAGVAGQMALALARPLGKAAGPAVERWIADLQAAAAALEARRNRAGERK